MAYMAYGSGRCEFKKLNQYRPAIQGKPCQYNSPTHYPANHHASQSSMCQSQGRLRKNVLNLMVCQSNSNTWAIVLHDRNIKSAIWPFFQYVLTTSIKMVGANPPSFRFFFFFFRPLFIAQWPRPSDTCGVFFLPIRGNSKVQQLPLSPFWTVPFCCSHSTWWALGTCRCRLAVVIGFSVKCS